MWTSRSREHAPKHHPPLPSKPYILIGAARSLGRFDLEHAPPARLHVDGQTPQSPFLERASGGHGASPARQGFGLHAPLVSPHPPHPLRAPWRNEVDVGAFRADGRVEAERPAAALKIELVDVVQEDNEGRRSHPAHTG